MTPEIEFCCVCHVETIEIFTDADYNFESGTYTDATTIFTKGAVDGRDFGYSAGTYVGPKCAQAIAA
jgi:hypothetical protein